MFFVPSGEQTTYACPAFGTPLFILASDRCFYYGRTVETAEGTLRGVEFHPHDGLKPFPGDEFEIHLVHIMPDDEEASAVVL